MIGALVLAGLLCASAASPEGATRPTEHTSRGLYRPPAEPRPSRQAALSLVDQLIEQARAPAVDPRWLKTAWRPIALVMPPSTAWYARAAAALGPDGGLGERLRATGGVVAAVPGPDYVRVLIAGQPLLGVVVRTAPNGAPVIDRIEPTTCGLCTEPARFVRDLLADVTRRRSASDRLLPGIELDVQGWLDQHPAIVPHYWLASLQARNRDGGRLTWLLTGARVTGVHGDVVHVRLADGTRDTWTVHYRNGTWQVDYAALPAKSPLRLSPAAAKSWRSEVTHKDAALHGWTPPWLRTADGAGVLVGDRAVGAAFDPVDGTVLVGVLDLDRTLAGIFRVDPDRRLVVERFAVPPPGDTTPIPWATWFTRWSMALSPDARHVAISAPGRVWTIDLQSGAVHLAWRDDDVSALAWAREDGRDRLVAGDDRGVLAVLGDGGWSRAIGDAPLEVGLDGDTLLAVGKDGFLWSIPRTGEPLSIRACPERATDAAWRPDGGSVLVTCGGGSGVLAVQVPWPPGTPQPIAGTPTARGGASYSPDGRWFTTGAAGDGDPLILWDAETGHPVATLGVGAVKHVAWSPDATQILTVGTDGRVWLWDVATVRRDRGL